MISRTNRVWCSVAAALTAAWSLPGQVVISHADVPLAAPVVQNFSWQTRRVTLDASGHQVQVDQPSYTTWVRLNPPAVATIGQPPGFTVLEDGRGTLKRSVTGTYQMRLTGAPGQKALRAEVERLLRNAEQPGEDASVTKKRDWTTVTYAPQPVGRDREKRTLFSSDTKFAIHLGNSKDVLPMMHFFWHRDIWVDPATHLVTRTEFRSWSSKESGQFNQRQHTVEDNFQYNQTPAPGVFDWSPPKGAEVRCSTLAQEAHEAERRRLAYRKSQWQTALKKGKE